MTRNQIPKDLEKALTIIAKGYWRQFLELHNKIVECEKQIEYHKAAQLQLTDAVENMQFYTLETIDLHQAEYVNEIFNKYSKEYSKEDLQEIMEKILDNTAVY